MAESTQKRCARCAEVKPSASFGKNSANPDGLQYHCRDCCKASRQTWTPERKEAKRRANMRYMARQRAKKRDEINAKQREFAQANPELIREYRQRFRANNPDKMRAYRARYYRANQEKFWEHVQRRRARIRGSAVGPVNLKALWTGTCGICSEVIDPALRHPDPMSRSIDHIVPLARGGSHTQDNLQYAHLVCNLRKHAKSP